MYILLPLVLSPKQETLMHWVAKRKGTFISVMSVLFLLFSLSFCHLQPSAWPELEATERASLLEYKKEVGLDYVYCMRVLASNESYRAIIQNRGLIHSIGKQIRFPVECRSMPWWDLPDTSCPEYIGKTNVDSQTLILKLNGVIYFSSQIW